MPFENCSQLVLNRIKIMKKFALTLTMTFLTIGLYAQDKTGNTDVQTKLSTNQDNSYRSTLVLKLEQESAYREIIKRYAMITRDLRKAGLTIDQKEVKMHEIDLQRDAEIKLLLTPEQFKDYLHDKEERGKRSVGLQKKQHPLGTK